MRHCERSVAIFAVNLCLLLIHSFPVQAYEIDRTKSVNISAAIEDSRVMIYGFTSPLAKVELSSSIVYDLTYAKENGYFEFDRIIIPRNPGELCLSAVDDDSRHTNPICVPPPPDTNYLTSIGPIILPPTISIDSNSVKANSTTATSGQSIPYSNINIYLYQSNASAPIIPVPAQAFGLPIFTTTTDINGNYSLNIPTSLSSDYRIFSTVEFATLGSPKSNTIVYSLPTPFNFYILIPLFISTIILFSYLLYLYFRPTTHLVYPPAIYYYPLALVQ